MNPISIDLLQQFFTLARGRSEDELEDCLSDFPDDLEQDRELERLMCAAEARMDALKEDGLWPPRRDG